IWICGNSLEKRGELVGHARDRFPIEPFRVGRELDLELVAGVHQDGERVIRAVVSGEIMNRQRIIRPVKRGIDRVVFEYEDALEKQRAWRDLAHGLDLRERAEA